MLKKQSKQSILLISFLVAMGVILLLLFYIIVQKPKDFPTDNTKSNQLRDSISLLTKQIDKERSYTYLYKYIADSLLSLPPVITIIYREQKKFTSIATIEQLDSIIRTNSGLVPRLKRR